MDVGRADWGVIKSDIQNLEHTPNTESTIFNGGEAPDSGVSRCSLSPQQGIDIQNGKVLIILGGRVEYFDAAGTRHNTTWCIIYIPDPVGTPHVARWHSCPISSIAD
jgi:hypothetical protein